jgi:hypothetical protein
VDWEEPVYPEFDLLTRTISPDFTMAKALKEILDNAYDSLLALVEKEPRLLIDPKWRPQIVMQIDLRANNGSKTLRVVDNGGGCSPEELKLWASLGSSTTKRKKEGLAGAALHGLFGGRIGEYGVGSKGAAAALTTQAACSRPCTHPWSEAALTQALTRRRRTAR